MSISEGRIDAIEWQLFNCTRDSSRQLSPNVFAVLDGARDKRIEPLLNNGDLPSACLYKGQMSYAKKRSAPHIVQLVSGHPQTRKILSTAWGNSWGIFAICNSSVNLNLIASRYRRISRAKLPDGKLVVFRYYDPRVARLLLPVCDQDESDQLLAGSSALLMEGQDPKSYLVFESSGGSASITTHVRAFGQEPVSINGSADRLVKRASLGVFEMRQQHLDALQDRAIREELELIKNIYVESYLTNVPDQNNSGYESPLAVSIGGKKIDLSTFIRLCFNKAKTFTLDDRISLLQFIYLNHHHGWGFWKKSEYRWVEDILSSSRPAEAKMQAIDKELSRRLMDKVWG